MSKTIIAIYEGGMLRPLQPLSLPEHSQVQLRLVKSGPATASTSERTIQALLSTGRIRRLQVDLLPEAERKAGREEPPTVAGPSLADTIIAQRRGDL